MSDRELLELAAKAAGYQLETDNYVDSYEMYLDGEHWSPLENDGDALRLAVKLEIDLSFYEGETEAIYWSDGTANRRPRCSERGLDSMAITRRAIVRAAAEIGKAMP